MSVLRVLWAVLVKDVQAELRTRQSLMAMVVFAALTVVVFNFAFPSVRAETVRIAPGVMWVAFAFAGVLGLNRSFALETEAGAVTALLASPADRGAIYLGKMLANAAFIAVLQALVVPLFVVLYNLGRPAETGRLVVILVLGAVAFSAAGTAFAGVAANTRMRDVMTPLLLFPAATPVLIAAVEGTGMALRGDEAGFGGAVRLLVGFTAAYTAAAYLLFEYVLEE